MDNDNEIFRIFSALDSDNRGFIDKDELMKRIADFTSGPGELDEKCIRQVEGLMESGAQISLQQFQTLYHEIQRIKRESFDAVANDSSSESCDGSGSSDIDNIDDKKRSGRRRKFIPPAVSVIREPIQSDSILSSPKSAKQHGRELLNNSKTSLLRRINSPLIIDSRETTASCVDRDFTEEVDKIQQDIETLTEVNDQLKEEIEDLQMQLREEQMRYLKEKEQHRLSSQRVLELENQIDEMKVDHKNEIRRNNEECGHKLQSMETSVEQTTEKFRTRCDDLENQISLLKRENENLLSQCQQLGSENDAVHKECRVLLTQKQESETILMEYKQVASKQVTELQTERDNLEMTNLQLYTELQTIKHTSPTTRTKHRSLVMDSTTSNRTRASSVVESPVMRHPVEPTIKENRLSKSQTDSIESDSNRLVHSLTMENRNLVERIAHLETVNFYQRQKLEAANCLSLAAEMEQLNIDELKAALTVERETVKTLKLYMETLTTKLLTAGYIDVFQLG